MVTLFHLDSLAKLCLNNWGNNWGQCKIKYLTRRSSVLESHFDAHHKLIYWNNHCHVPPASE